MSASQIGPTGLYRRQARGEDIMTIAKRLGFLGFLFVLGGTALSATAHADALATAKPDIDAWIQKLGGTTLSNQPVPSTLPAQLKTTLEKLPCTSKAELAKVEAYIHQEINKLQLSHKVKIDYGLNTECRPAPGKTAAPGKPVPLMTAATVWIRGYKDYKPSEDKPASTLTVPELLRETKTAPDIGTTWAKECAADKDRVACCATKRKANRFCAQGTALLAACETSERICRDK